ncbi:hypothetical protein C4580_01235 [Candidatus Woesearchaeota archaeon]|nr:MAG: hypothetical protein C4580_01235 [Candidatus Woesearchaeota archaeon]
MQKGVILLLVLVLAACSAPTEVAQTPTPVEVPAEEEVAPPVEEVQTPEVAVPETVVVSNVSENVSDVETERVPQVPVKLTAARQAEYFPAVEKAVLESPCYQLSWVDFERYANSSPLAVEKSVRYEYRERLQWKGWISYKLFHSRNLLASETVAVIIDDGNVSCPRAGPFTIDWQDSLERLRNR